MAKSRGLQLSDRANKRSTIDVNIRNLSTSINFVISLVILIYIYLAYNYLSNLKSCKCVEGKYVGKVKVAEGLLMGIVLFWIIVSLWMTNNIQNMSRNEITILLYLAGAVGIFTFLVYIYFCYYVRKMMKSLKSSCVCAMKWQRWLVWIQYGFFLYEIALVIISVLIGIVYMLLHLK